MSMKFGKQTIAALGMSKLASGTISPSSPVAFIDISLPIGFDEFVFEFVNFIFDDVDNLSAAFSYDGGKTFICDRNNIDSYTTLMMKALTSQATVQKFSLNDSLIDVAALIDGNVMSISSWRVFPGNLDVPAGCMNQDCGGTTSGRGLSSAFVTVNPNATVPPPAGRVNLMRFLPNGRGDCNPPTSGVSIIGGSYICWGIKS